MPPALALPTGTGKTSVIPIYSLALAHGASIPRRLVYVVNRRVVVDQATVVAQGLVDSPLVGPLNVSTMRGQRADDTAWLADPSTPAVIVGTVDMIGSRLLFQGYRTGRSLRPIYAGLLGHDATIVLDEAHLEPAFDAVLDAVRAHGAGIRLVRMTATPRAAGTNGTTGTAEPPPLALSPEDEAPSELGLRLWAVKRLDFTPGPLAQRALEHKKSSRAVIVYCDRVDDARDVAARLEEKGQQVAVLTGTMRGLERDRMVASDPIFARFLPSPAPGVEPASGTVYLVSTSAGEVGVDLSADDAVMDIVPLERMIQRFGRVNRAGLHTDSTITVCGRNHHGKRGAQATTCLLRLKGDASPSSVSSLVASMSEAERRDAFSEPPEIRPLADTTVDLWSLTTPGRQLVVPPVEPFLHGVPARPELPQTTVAWRREVAIPGLGPDILDDYPLRPHELAQDRRDRVLEHLADADPTTPVWVIDADVFETTVGDLNRATIAWKTLVVPPGIASSWIGSDATDVADALDDRRRIEHGIDDPPPPIPLGMRVARREEDDSTVRWWLVCPVVRIATTVSGQELATHLAACERAAQRIATTLPITDAERTAIVVASALHDLGKGRVLWQRAAGNDRGPPLAKPRGRMNPRALRRYRHELGSVIDMAGRQELARLDPDTRELVTWLVAAHHGRARPHFPGREALDPERSDAAIRSAVESTPHLFARLQPKVGRWRLAFLQALRLAADIAGEKEDLA